MQTTNKINITFTQTELQESSVFTFIIKIDVNKRMQRNQKIN